MTSVLGRIPGTAGGITTSCAGRNLVSASLAAPDWGWSARAHDTVLPRRRMATLHPFSNRMYPLGPQMLGTWTSVLSVPRSRGTDMPGTTPHATGME